MEKFLYFNTGGDSDATTESFTYPVSSLRGMDIATGDLLLHFTPMKITDVATSDVVDVVTLDVTDTNQKAVMASICRAINATGPQYNDGFIVVFDKDADPDIKLNDLITGCALTLAA